MVSPVQCPRGQEDNPRYAHLPRYVGDRLVAGPGPGVTFSEPIPLAPQPTQLDRIEQNQQIIIEQNNRLLEAFAALAGEEEQEDPAQTLDGEYAGSERDQNQPL